MANTGYTINPKVIQIFTSGPNSGSEVTSSFSVTFDSGSGFISTSLCNQYFYNKIYDPYNCIVPSLCVPPIISNTSPKFCDSSYNYIYQFDLYAGSGSLPGIKIEYSLDSGFSGEVKGTTITDYVGSTITPLEINIINGLTNRTEESSSGLTTLPLNQYTPVYFRAYSICSGSNSSSYSNIDEGKCNSLPPISPTFVLGGGSSTIQSQYIVGHLIMAPNTNFKWRVYLGGIYNNVTIEDGFNTPINVNTTGETTGIWNSGPSGTLYIISTLTSPLGSGNSAFADIIFGDIIDLTPFSPDGFFTLNVEQ